MSQKRGAKGPVERAPLAKEKAKRAERFARIRLPPIQKINAGLEELKKLRGGA
jgi:hypothetical protein